MSDTTGSAAILVILNTARTILELLPESVDYITNRLICIIARSVLTAILPERVENMALMAMSNSAMVVSNIAYRLPYY